MARRPRPKVGIVMPTFNQEAYLPTALDGVLAQRDADFSLVVVNDGSTDGTAGVLADYEPRLPMEVIHQKNQGLPAALNTGFGAARGEYLTWTSSDNVMLPRMLEVLARALDAYPSAGVVYADWYFIDDLGEVQGLYRTLDYDPLLLFRHNFVHCCFLFRRECLDQVGGYDPRYAYYEDWEWWIRVSRHFHMRRIPEPLYLYRVHRRSLTAQLLSVPSERLTYPEFARRLRRQSPLRWYASFVKWAWMKKQLGRDPLAEWDSAISSANGAERIAEPRRT